MFSLEMDETRESPPPPPRDGAAERTPLAGEFAPATREAWEALVRAKDADAERPLVTSLEEGLEVWWLYTAADELGADPGGLPGGAPFTRGVRAGAPWAIRQRVATPDRRRANAEILEELEGGATEILLALDPTGAHGIPVRSVEELDETLDGVMLDLAPVALEADPTGADLLLELLRRRGHTGAEPGGSLRLNPFGLRSPGPPASGAAAHSAHSLGVEDAVARVSRVRSEFPRLNVLAVDTAPWVDAGAGGVLELALSLACGVALLRAGEVAGIDPAEMAAATEFTLAVGPDQFLEIARLRAARRLWAAVLEHCGVAPPQRHSRLYARTSRRMYSSLDPWVNLLRATTAGFAAAVGGADGLCVLPFDEPHGTGLAAPGPLGRRMARNTQLLLCEEASLHRVADPAGGSWYVESLTDQTAQAAWTEFQRIESEGGIEAVLTSGALEAQFASAAAERRYEIATRRRALTGVNQFPLLGDDGLERPQPDGATSAAVVRDAADFEALRDRAARLDDARILLAGSGPLTAHANVTGWATGFFEAGGVRAIASGPDPDVAALVREHGVRVAAVCVGADSDPSTILGQLRDAGVSVLYAVGADVDGVERVRDGVDMVAVLSGLLDRLEEAR